MARAPQGTAATAPASWQISENFCDILPVGLLQSVSQTVLIVGPPARAWPLRPSDSPSRAATMTICIADLLIAEGSPVRGLGRGLGAWAGGRGVGQAPGLPVSRRLLMGGPPPGNGGGMWPSSSRFIVPRRLSEVGRARDYAGRVRIYQIALQHWQRVAAALVC